MRVEQLISTVIVVGTALNFEVIGEAIGTLRKCNFVNENWKERIDEDFHKRSKSHNK